jgi:hypothetical protein
MTMRLRGPWLMDTITLSAGYSFSVPGASMIFTFLILAYIDEDHALVRISTGALQYSKFTPSSVASLNSCWLAATSGVREKQVSCPHALAQRGARNIHGRIAAR